MKERMAVIFGPASWLPTCSQFLRPRAIGRIAFSQEVLVDLDATILEVDLQARPLVEGVLAGFCEFARWQSVKSNLGDFRLEFLKERNASLLSHCQTLLLGGSDLASFLFHGIEFAHEPEDSGGLAILGIELESVVKFSARVGKGHPARTMSGAPIFS